MQGEGERRRCSTGGCPARRRWARGGVGGGLYEGAIRGEALRPLQDGTSALVMSMSGRMASRLVTPRFRSVRFLAVIWEGRAAALLCASRRPCPGQLGGAPITLPQPVPASDPYLFGQTPQEALAGLEARESQQPHVNAVSHLCDANCRNAGIQLVRRRMDKLHARQRARLSFPAYGVLRACWSQSREPWARASSASCLADHGVEAGDRAVNPGMQVRWP